MNQIDIALSNYNSEQSKLAHRGLPPLRIKNILIGRNQWEMLAEEASAYGITFHEDIEEMHEANRPEWQGYKIYRVDAQDHISFST